MNINTEHIHRKARIVTRMKLLLEKTAEKKEKT